MNPFQRALRYLAGKLSGMTESRVILVLAFITGLLSGVAAITLKKLIYFFGWLLKGWFNTPAESLLYLVYPGIGMLIALLFVKFIIKDNIGHGVTKVLLSISRNESKIKSHNTWSSVAASSVTIGFGGSVGAEAPIVYTGAAIGSNIARLMGLSYKNMTILLGCGAAGAVAGIFKAPLAGILFTLEILLFNLSMTSIIPLLVSAVTAATVSYFFMGDAVVFSNTIEAFAMRNIPFYLVLGIVCGFISLYFTRTTLRVEDRIQKISNSYKRWAISAFMLGLLIFIFPPLFGEGYGSITALLNKDALSAVGPNIFGDLFSNKWFVPAFFGAIIFFKVFAMSFTNAGGGVGGTFGPTLFIGGVTGFVVSRVLNLTGLFVIPESNFALVGMAGLMAGVMQAPLTAIFLIAEITGGYVLLMPLIITSVVSYATIRAFEPYSIYTKRLAKQGDLLTHDSDKAVLTLLKTSELVENDFKGVKPEDKLSDLIKVIAYSKRNIFPVVDNSGKFKGIILLDDIREIMFNKDIYESTFVEKIMKDPPGVVFNDDKMEVVMKKFEITSAWNLPVTDKQGNYIGFVSKSKIFSAYRDQLQQVSHD
ncbi:MAG: chloride channel protein [Bacteroidetes bacterium HGW-Bacteroidetes-7]|jgi:CIC family chloride channel protein|nr:MAG: chloride channel protein [Bacteroidetes bacterium HGW-Bacteroidetes-7]